MVGRSCLKALFAVLPVNWSCKKRDGEMATLEIVDPFNIVSWLVWKSGMVNSIVNHVSKGNNRVFFWIVNAENWFYLILHIFWFPIVENINQGCTWTRIVCISPIEITLPAIICCIVYSSLGPAPRPGRVIVMMCLCECVSVCLFVCLLWVNFCTMGELFNYGLTFELWVNFFDYGCTLHLLVNFCFMGDLW